MNTTAVTQRLHHDDLCAHLLRHSKEWLCLSLPAIATNDDPWRTVPGRALGRRKYEPLTPGVQSFEQHRALMHEIGAHNYAAQYQQTPYSQMNDQAARGGCFGARDTAAGFARHVVWHDPGDADPGLRDLWYRRQPPCRPTAQDVR